MITSKNSRRIFIGKCLQLAAAGVLGGCAVKKSGGEEKEAVNNDPVDPCSDMTGISESEIEKREKFGYIDETLIPESQCGNCSLYISTDKEKACGGCMLFKGPVYASGYCTYWAPKV